MFSVGHLIWIAISLVLIVLGTALCLKKKPDINKLVLICLILGLVSEAVKMLSVTEIVPVVEPMVENGALIYKPTGEFRPYIEAEHLPFELCTLQIPFMALALIIEKGKWRKRLFALMYGTGIIGGLVAIFMASIAPEFPDTLSFFTAPRAWQFFLYHAMIVVLSIYIGFCDQCGVRFSDMKWMMILVTLLDFLSFYMNSMMTVPYYSGKELMGLVYATNYFSSYNDPIGIVLSEKYQWYIYLAVRIAIALVLTPLVFSFLLLKKDRKKGEKIA